jgi:malonyl-CoA O-methyltransferase
MVAIKDIVRRNFSRSAHCYDEYATVQTMSAQQLLEHLPEKGPDRALDIGCGTGIYTDMVCNRYPGAAMTVVDHAPGMIDKVRSKIVGSHMTYVLADAESWHTDRTFDLITSNATMQWFEYLEHTLRYYESLLAPTGTMAVSLFGPQTYHELGSVLQRLYGADCRIPSHSFVNKEQLEATCETLSRSYMVTERVITQEEPSVRALLKKIKYTGTQGKGISLSGLWTPRMLERIEKEYRTCFGRVMVTYQILICIGGIGV